jgi:hypothetical protein
MTAATKKIEAEAEVEAPSILVDPLRAELAAAIADRAVVQDAISSAKGAVARLTALVAKAEAKHSQASVRAEFEDAEHIEHLAETARSRAPESTPLSYPSQSR